MKTIWKFAVGDVRFALELPAGAQFRHLDTQDGALCAWFDVDGSADTGPRAFEWFGTGYPIPDRAVYLATAVLPGGLVFHLHEVTS